MPEIPPLGSAPIEHETSSTTSENPLEAEETTDHDENVLVDDNLTSEDPLDNEVIDECRGDDKFRCGTTNVYICDIQRCDGTKNCPNGEDELPERCPTSMPGAHEVISSNDDDGSGEEEEISPPSDIPEVEAPAGDFLLFIISKFHSFYYFTF